MVYHTSLRDNGCVDVVYNPPAAVWNVACVPTRVAHSSRLMMVGGPTWCVPSGFQKLGLPTQYFLNQLIALPTFLQPGNYFIFLGILKIKAYV